MARIAPALPITDKEFSEIEVLLGKHSLEQSVAKRCRAVLLAADSKSNVEIGLKVGQNPISVPNPMGF